MFEKWPNLKFHENSSSGSQADPWRCMDRQTGMTNLIVTFHNFANVPKNGAYDILVSTHVTYMGAITEFFPNKNLEIYYENV